MPSYGYLRLGCQTIANPQQTIDYLTCSTEAPRVPFHVQVMSEPCTAARTNLGQPFVSPAADEAPWYNGTAASGEFLGMIVSDMTGLDGTLKREITARAVGIGGGALGPMRAGHRELQVRATMYAASCEGMDHGIRWLTNTLYGGACGPSETCDLELWTGCPDNGTLNQSRWFLKNVSVLTGPTFAEGPLDYNPCNIREVEFTLASEEPWLYKCPVNLTDKATALTAPSTGCWTVCRWLDFRTELATTFNTSNPVGYVGGLDTFDLSFRAGPNRPLNAEVLAWSNTHGPSNCSILTRPSIGDTSWFYDVASDGTWTRWNIDSDYVISGRSVSGSGAITGTATPEAIDTYRDIKVQLPKSTYTHALRMEHFRDGLLVGGDLTGGLVVKDWTGVAHLEGLLVSASAVGISGASTGSQSELHVRQVRISGCSSTGLWVGHMDELLVDGLTIAESGQRALWMDPTSADGITQAVIRRYNAYTDTASGAKSLFRQGGRYHVLLQEVDLVVNNGYTGADRWESYCGPAWEFFDYEPLEDIGLQAVRWPSDSGIRGFLFPFLGGDDIVQAGTVGAHYSATDVPLGTPCMELAIVNLPQNHTLKIESSTRRIRAYDPSGKQVNGYAFVQVPDGKGFGWLETDCDPLCLKVVQRRAYEGDGATLEVIQLHREL